MRRSWIHGGTVLARVGPHHLAFLRGYLEGLDLSSLSKRYLETAIVPDPELRVAKSTLKWIREQLLVAARRRGHFPEARLILIDPEKLRQSSAQRVPNLEEFREERDPHELYSEAELLELFEEEYGKSSLNDRHTRRNERLRKRQLSALSELEKLLGAPPSLQDDVSGWIDPLLAKRLKDAGLHTLNELVTEINGRGYRWWICVPRLGEKAAAQVVAWLQTESVQQSLGVKLQPQATIKSSKLPAATIAANRGRQFGIVPLEHLALPPMLDGSSGTNRGKDCRIAAANDIEAINLWLARVPASSSTWRSYRKEAERALLWAVIERQLPLSSLSASDCNAYCDFIKRLDSSAYPEWPFRSARANWLAPRGTKRWSQLWRPFEGPLAPESRKLAITILTLLGRWLVDQGYWKLNPWDQVANIDNETRKDGKLRRSLTPYHWDQLWRYVTAMQDTEKRERARFILTLCRTTGMRLSELSLAQVGHLRKLVGDDGVGERWILDVPTPKAHRSIELPSETISALEQYLVHRGFESLTHCSKSTYLIGRLPSSLVSMKDLEPVRPEISPSALHQILKRLFSDAATYLSGQIATDCNLTAGARNDDAISLDQLRLATSHWLRSLTTSADDSKAPR